MKVKAHTRYRNKDGKVVPGVTTILGLLNKPALVRWANKMGLNGIDTTKYVDDKAAIGTLTHSMIEAFLKGEECITDDYSYNQIQQALVSYAKFEQWWKDNQPEIILSEAKLVSEKHQYGGTCDLLCKINGKLTLVDFKTSNGIYNEMVYQLSAYRQLLREAGYAVSRARILRIGRTEDEGFEERHYNHGQLTKGLKIFKHLRCIYDLQKGEL